MGPFSWCQMCSKHSIVQGGKILPPDHNKSIAVCSFVHNIYMIVRICYGWRMLHHYSWCCGWIIARRFVFSRRKAIYQSIHELSTKIFHSWNHMAGRWHRSIPHSTASIQQLVGSRVCTQLSLGLFNRALTTQVWGVAPASAASYSQHRDFLCWYWDFVRFILGTRPGLGQPSGWWLGPWCGSKGASAIHKSPNAGMYLQVHVYIYIHIHTWQAWCSFEGKNQWLVTRLKLSCQWGKDLELLPGDRLLSLLWAIN